METSAKLLFALSLLGVAQALLLAAALLSIKRGDRIANRFLAAFVSVIAIGVGGATLATDRFIPSFPHFLKIQDPIYVLGAPLLYLYVSTLIKGRSKSGKKDILHFIPFILCLLYFIPFYFQSGEPKLFSVGSNFDYWARGSYIRSITLIVQFIIYLALVAALLISYQRKLRQQSSPSKSPSYSRSDFCWRPQQPFG